MSDLEVYAALALMVGAGFVMTRLNPTVMGARSATRFLAAFAVIGAVVVLLLVILYGAPVLTPSGVLNPEGG